MSSFQTRWFTRWANKEELNASTLSDAIREITEGLYDADLGGGLLKKRIARRGGGKRGGFRVLVATNRTRNRLIFLYGFPKNERSNIDKDEEEALKKLASHLLSLTDQELKKAQRAGELMEVNSDEKKKI